MSRNAKIFTQVPIKRAKRNLFDLSHEVKMSGKFSFLYPVLIQETLPGDTFRNTSTNLVRLAPMLAPVMHRIDVTTHFFFVPYRLLCDDWESFITGGQDGTEAPVLPYVTPAGITLASGAADVMKKQTLWDYLGLPVIDSASVAASSLEQISAFPFRAYAKVWNDYYRDPNFDDEKDLATEVNGDVSANTYAQDLFQLERRAWQKDYFTACLPFAQRGDAVLLPLAGTGSVEYSPVTSLVGGAALTNGNMQVANYLSGTIKKPTDSVGVGIQIQNIDSVTLDSSSVTINDFRTALAIQSWLENNARGGARYNEQILSHFSVQVPDYRLQRAEYLGGGKQPVQISEVLSTANTDSDPGLGTEYTPIGDMAGHGISVGKSNQFTYRCSEHGIILGIMSVIPASAYQQGLDRMWSRKSKFDFAWPELAHLGEQEVLSKEVFFSFDVADDPDNNSTFGYIPRYSDYKFKNDRVAGDFRDNLQFWHLGRIFKQRPVLDEAFTTTNEAETVEEDTMRRIFAVESNDDYLWIDIFHRFTAVRPLPYFGVPRLVG